MKKRILVVDDDHPIRRMVSRILSLGNPEVEVEQASGGEQALTKLAESSYDLLLLDFMMPEVTGMEVLQSLRASDKHRELPVIMLTARSQETDVVATLESGANYFVKKPFEPQELLSIVSTVLELPMQI